MNMFQLRKANTQLTRECKLLKAALVAKWGLLAVSIVGNIVMIVLLW